MPSLMELGDSDAVDNKYVDRIVFYVEGNDDKNLFAVYLMKHCVSKVEIKTTSTLGGGYGAVISRVNDERIGNKNIFGIVDGEALLPLGHISEYKDMFGGSDWISVSQFDGIYFLPCWEIENLLCVRDILPATLIAQMPVSQLTEWTERAIENVVLIEAFRLSELSALNLALLAESHPIVKAETKSSIAKRRDLLAEIENIIAPLTQACLVRNRYHKWREFFRDLLRESSTRDEIYDAFVSRVDGKALFVRLKRRLRFGGDIRSSLAHNFSNNEKAMEIVQLLLHTVNRRLI